MYATGPCTSILKSLQEKKIYMKGLNSAQVARGIKKLLVKKFQVLMQNIWTISGIRGLLDLFCLLVFSTM